MARRQYNYSSYLQVSDLLKKLKLKINSEWIGENDVKRKQLLHTEYHAVTQSFENPLATKW